MNKYLVLCAFLCTFLLIQTHLHANEELCNEYSPNLKKAQSWPHIQPPSEDLGIRLELRKNPEKGKGNNWIQIKYKRGSNGKMTSYEWWYDYQGQICKKPNDKEVTK